MLAQILQLVNGWLDGAAVRYRDARVLLRSTSLALGGVWPLDHEAAPHDPSGTNPAQAMPMWTLLGRRRPNSQLGLAAKAVARIVLPAESWPAHSAGRLGGQHGLFEELGIERHQDSIAIGFPIGG